MQEPGGMDGVSPGGGSGFWMCLKAEPCDLLGAGRRWEEWKQSRMTVFLCASRWVDGAAE